MLAGREVEEGGVEGSTRGVYEEATSIIARKADRRWDRKRISEAPEDVLVKGRGKGNM